MGLADWQPAWPTFPKFTPGCTLLALRPSRDGQHQTYNTPTLGSGRKADVGVKRVMLILLTAQ